MTTAVIPFHDLTARTVPVILKRELQNLRPSTLWQQEELHKQLCIGHERQHDSGSCGLWPKLSQHCSLPICHLTPRRIVTAAPSPSKIFRL